MPWRYIIMVVVLFSAQSNFVSGGELEGSAYWDGGDDGNGEWLDPYNWQTGEGTPNIPPDENTGALIQPILPGPNVAADACCAFLEVQPWSWGGAPNIEVNIFPPGTTPGTFNAGYYIGIGNNVDYNSEMTGHGIINIYSGTVLTPASYIEQPDYNGLWIGGSSSKTGSCYGVLNMFGGLTTVPRISLYYGVINLYGGALEGTHGPSYRNDFFISDLHTLNKINLAGGTLRLKSDWTTDVNSYVSAGQIVAYNGQRSVIVNYNTSTGFTTATSSCPVSDFTNDCQTNIDDVNVMSQEWLIDEPIKADIYPQGTPDGIVDFRDFAILAENWLVE